MRDDLYFIPMIAAALQEPDPKAALMATFERARAMGSEPRYQRGYRQFMDFMASAFSAGWADATQDAGIQRPEDLDHTLSAEIVVERNGAHFALCRFDQAVGVHAVGAAKPGSYRVLFHTGRLLWEGELANEDLLWANAHPSQDLPMAADMGDSPRSPTRSMDLLDGVVVLRVYAGLEAGTLEIELKDPRKGK